MLSCFRARFQHPLGLQFIQKLIKGKSSSIISVDSRAYYEVILNFNSSLQKIGLNEHIRLDLSLTQHLFLKIENSSRNQE